MHVKRRFYTSHKDLQNLRKVIGGDVKFPLELLNFLIVARKRDGNSKPRHNGWPGQGGRGGGGRENCRVKEAQPGRV